MANTALTSNGVANHVALVREGNDFSIYMNGVLDSTSTLALDGDLLIERLATNVRATKALSGTLDEFRVWDDARSASEIATYMNQEVASNAEDLLRYYQFDDDTFVIDSTGNAEAAGDLSYASISGVDWFEFSDWLGA